MITLVGIPVRSGGLGSDTPRSRVWMNLPAGPDWPSQVGAPPIWLLVVVGAAGTGLLVAVRSWCSSWRCAWSGPAISNRGICCAGGVEMLPETRFAWAGELSIAYQRFGVGPLRTRVQWVATGTATRTPAPVRECAGPRNRAEPSIWPRGPAVRVAERRTIARQSQPRPALIRAAR